jgi:hypothetical protein
MRLSIAKGEAQGCINFSLQYFEFKLYELIVLAVWRRPWQREERLDLKDSGYKGEGRSYQEDYQ